MPNTGVSLIAPVCPSWSLAVGQLKGQIMNGMVFMLVGCGGAIGGAARFVVSDAIGRLRGTAFPWGTLVVNVTGAFLIGVVAGLARSFAGIYASPLTSDFIITGILGGYTTVSSFCMQTINLVLAKDTRFAVYNVAGSTVFCLLAVAIGYLGVVRLAA